MQNYFQKLYCNSCIGFIFLYSNPLWGDFLNPLRNMFFFLQNNFLFQEILIPNLSCEIRQEGRNVTNIGDLIGIYIVGYGN